MADHITDSIKEIQKPSINFAPNEVQNQQESVNQARKNFSENTVRSSDMVKSGQLPDLQLTDKENKVQEGSGNAVHKGITGHESHRPNHVQPDASHAHVAKSHDLKGPQGSESTDGNATKLGVVALGQKVELGVKDMNLVHKPAH